MQERIARPRRVLLVVPRPVRDLEGHALVGYYLERRFHHDVQLSTGAGTEEAMLDYKPDVVVLDVVGHEDRLRQARLAKAAGAKVCVLPTAGVFPDQRGFLRLVGEANGGCELVDCYLSWGHFAAEAIVAKRAMPPDRVQLTGCPRFDFYANESLGGVPQRSEFLQRIGIENVKAPVIVWSTNTNNYNRAGSLEKYIRTLARNDGFNESDLRVEIEDERRQLEAHSQVVLELARRYPSCNFVVKVHPLEQREFYVRWARQARNIIVSPNFSIRDFVFHCDVLVQRGCTTATEFWTQGKPVLELQMGEFQTTWAPVEHAEGNHSVFTVDDAARAISHYLADGSIPAAQHMAREAYFEKFYYRIDGLCSLRCAERIHREITGERYTDANQRCTREMFASIRDQRERSGRCDRLRRVFGIPADRALRPWKRSFWIAPRRIDQQVVAQLYQRYDYALADGMNRAAKNVESLPTRS